MSSRLAAECGVTSKALSAGEVAVLCKLRRKAQSMRECKDR